MSIRTYSEMMQFESFNERFDYLQLRGAVGAITFGFERYINQGFYRSTQWKQIRSKVIARDSGRDLAAEGYEIHDAVIVHHMNPMTAAAIEDGSADILNPEYLISTTLQTHNAIHYGDASLLRQPYTERSPRDTALW